MISVTVKRIKGDFGFEGTDANGHVVQMDSNPESGGIDFGIRPMQMLLVGLAGCSGIDVISILKKQRQEVEGFTMKVNGEREKGKEPSLWQTVHIEFNLSGNIDPDKAKRACALSIDKYCSVAETLRRGGTDITWSLNVNTQEANEVPLFQEQ